MDINKTINLLKGKPWASHNTDCDCIYCESLQLAIDSLERTRWIPVSERLPELKDTNGEYEVIGYESNFKIVSTQHYADFEMNKKLTHWMPLPNFPGVE